MTDIKPCTVKGCRATTIHHHRRDTNNAVGTDCAENKGLPCPFVPDDKWTPPAAPRLTRKALNARIAALEAENADLHAEIADKKDRLARCEKAVVAVTPKPASLSDLAASALARALRGNNAAGAEKFSYVLDSVVRGGLDRRVEL